MSLWIRPQSVPASGNRFWGQRVQGEVAPMILAPHTRVQRLGVRCAHVSDNQAWRLDCNNGHVSSHYVPSRFEARHDQFGAG
jgi:hypothetical protein